MSISEAGALALVEQRLPAVMAAYPDLNPCGYVGDAFDYYPPCRPERFLDAKGRIAEAIRWLLESERRTDKRFPTTAFHLTYVMERETGVYVDEGDLIAAFLILGLPIELDFYAASVQVVA